MAEKATGCQSQAQTDVSTPDISVPSPRRKLGRFRAASLEIRLSEERC